MKVVVCGCRRWTDKTIIRKRLAKLPPDSIIIEGGCTGADLMGRLVALEIGLEVVEFPAAWKKWGKAAGPKRNIKMLDTKPHLLLAFHNDLESSRGTKHIVKEAIHRGIPVEVIDNRV